jgi:hypothetical protein
MRTFERFPAAFSATGSLAASERWGIFAFSANSADQLVKKI